MKKPGWKTSEGVMAYAMALLGGGYGLQDGDPMVRASALAAIGFVFGMYALSRGSAKKGGA